MVLKCKMCGGDIQISSELTHGTCDSCGTATTLPNLKNENSEQKANSYNRANHFRMQNDFDKALSIYEKLIGEDDTDAEAHWCAVLCRFGIEYVTDPTSGKRVPTCHRASYDLILNDVDYLATIKNTQDEQTKSLYQQEANYIAEVQKNILAISQNESPYDVFICYKETDSSGNRTVDSTLAQDIYYQLTQSDYKVFYAKITLEDKLGQAYEPYIFSALNSAKVMLCIGTKPDHFNSVWVKNEWSRFLALMKNDHSRLLIPCYRDMDAYDIPDELAMLQSQDMSKIGFLQDLIRGIQKVLDESKPQTTNVSIVQNNVQVQPALGKGSTDTIAPLLKRIKLFLGEKNWGQALEYCERVLDLDPECGNAYVFQMCAYLNCASVYDLRRKTFKIKNTREYSLKEYLNNSSLIRDFNSEGKKSYQKALMFSDKSSIEELNDIIEYNHSKIEEKRLEKSYSQTISSIDRIAKHFENFNSFEYEKRKDVRSGLLKADNITVKIRGLERGIERLNKNIHYKESKHYLELAEKTLIEAKRVEPEMTEIIKKIIAEKEIEKVENQEQKAQQAKDEKSARIFSFFFLIFVSGILGGILGQLAFWLFG